MPLKASVAKIEDVAEPLRSLYKQSGSQFVLDLDGAEDLGKVGEFRENNLRLSREMETMKSQLAAFAGIDPEAVKSLREQAEKAKGEEEKALLKSGKFDEVIARRTAAFRADLDAQIKATNETLKQREETIKALTGRLSSTLVDTDLQKTIDAVGLKARQGAMEDLTRRAREVWRIDEKGNMVAIDPKATGPMYSSEKAGEPITMKEYVTKRLATEAAHLFEASGGGGAQGGQRAGGIPSGGYVSVSDPLEVGRHLKEISKGTVKVQMNE